jgi:hypothetical protein
MRLLDTVVELQQTVDALTAARAQIEGVPDWMRELHDEHSARRAELEALGAAVAEAAHAQRAAQAAAADADVRLKRFQDQISQVRNQREYSALLQEIDTAKAAIREHQAQALAALERQEAEQSRLSAAEEAFGEVDGRYQTQLAKWEAQKPDVAREAEALDGRREALRQRLPRALVVQFDLIARRYGGQALAAARRVDRTGRGQEMWHCSACNYRVRPQAIVEIRNLGAVVTCDSCKRILYLPEGGG